MVLRSSGSQSVRGSGEPSQSRDQRIVAQWLCLGPIARDGQAQVGHQTQRPASLQEIERYQARLKAHDSLDCSLGPDDLVAELGAAGNLAQGRGGARDVRVQRRAVPELPGRDAGG